jgi:acetyl esterase/lipase
MLSGTRDLFLSNSVRMHRRLRSDGVDAELHVFEAFSHCQQLNLPMSQESEEWFREQAAFLARHLR